MKPALFYDTETSKLPLFSDPSSHPEQPHIVQLAALLVDLDTRNTIASMDVIVRPDGWTIEPESEAIHGISNEYAMAVGIPESEALAFFLQLWNFRPRIAHNESFDARIIRIALNRFLNTVSPDAWKESQSECTARLSRPLCALPKSKMPTLTEAYLHFTGKALDGAHNAMSDTLACRDVYFAIKGANHG